MSEKRIWDNQRLFDLVRHQRGELQDANLITMEEYAYLVTEGSYAADRLSDYDGLKAELAEKDAAFRGALDLIDAKDQEIATLKAELQMARGGAGE